MLASTILSASGNEDMNVTTALTRLLVHSWDRVSWLGNEACNIEFRCDSIKKKSEQCRAAELVKLKKVTEFLKSKHKKAMEFLQSQVVALQGSNEILRRSNDKYKTRYSCVLRGRGVIVWQD